MRLPAAPSTSSGSPATPWTAVGVASSRRSTVTGDATTTLSASRAATLHTGAGLLTDRQRQRLTALFAGDRHVEVEATWGIYQRMIAAYREPNRTRSRELMSMLIDSVSQGVPKALSEVVMLGRT